MERENLEQIALAIEAAGNTAYKTTDWHSAPGYMRSAEIVRRFAILEAAPEPTSVAFHNLEVANQWLRREVERARAERPSLDLCQLDRDGYCSTHSSWRCFPERGEIAGVKSAAPLPEPEPTKGGDMTPTPDVSPVPPTAEPLWNLKQILDLIDYSTTSTVFEVATARDEVNQLRDLFQAHMPDGQPRCLDENPLPPSGPLSDPEGVFEAMGMDEPKFPTTKKEGE